MRLKKYSKFHIERVKRGISDIDLQNGGTASRVANLHRKCRLSAPRRQQENVYYNKAE
jgi:hypothetical protein